MRDKLIEKIKEQFDVSFYRTLEPESIELRFNCSDCELDVRIFYDESICIVDYSVIMLKDMDTEYRYHDVYLCCMIIQQLCKISNTAPNCDVYVSDKNGSIEIGYRMSKLKVERVLKYLGYFNEIRIKGERIDDAFLACKYPQLYSLYLKLRNEKKEAYTAFMMTNWSFHNRFIKIKKYSNKIADAFKDCDDVYINSRGSMITGFTIDTWKKICDDTLLHEVLFENIYFGIDYCIINISNDIKVWDIRLVKDAIHILRQLGFDYQVPVRYYYSDGLLLIECMEFWIIIIECPNKNMNQVIEERNRLRTLYANLIKYIPTEYRNVDYDFSILDEGEFENLCCELLIARGFKNVIRRGKTNAPDGGIDIEADEEYDTLLEHKSSHWIFQCKHTKRQINRKDICEIPFLMKEFKAEGYGVFYTNVFTPNTIDRFRDFNKGELYLCDINELSNLLNSYSKIAQKYFGL